MSLENDCLFYKSEKAVENCGQLALFCQKKQIFQAHVYCTCVFRTFPVATITGYRFSRRKSSEKKKTQKLRVEFFLKIFEIFVFKNSSEFERKMYCNNAESNLFVSLKSFKRTTFRRKFLLSFRELFSIFIE